MMCQRESANYNTKLLGCVSDIVVHSQQKSNNNKDQQQCKFSASTNTATDIYKRLCIIFFCDERETTQVASVTFTADGIRFVNLGASAGEETLPNSVFISRSMFVIYNVYPQEGVNEVQILINFSTLMDFLECAFANAQEDLIHPLHIVLDNWLYISLQRSPTIGDLDKAMSTSLATTIQRFCLIPTECYGGSLEEHTVPSCTDPNSESDEMMDNTILMLHPLNAKFIDPSAIYPMASTPKLTKQQQAKQAKHQPAKSPAASAASVAAKSPAPAPAPAAPANVDDEASAPADQPVDGENPNEPPRKRLKTTSEQISLLEEWFQKEPLPARKAREEMVQKLDGTVSLRQLEVWFQNRRAKQKKLEARAQKGRAGEVPSATPPSSPSPPSTPPPIALQSMAPNPEALIPASSPSPSPATTPSPKGRAKPKSKAINSQGVPVSPPQQGAPSPVPMSPPTRPSNKRPLNSSPASPASPSPVPSKLPSVQ